VTRASAFSPFFVGVFPTGFVSADTGNSPLSDSPALTLILLSFWLLLLALRKQTDLRFSSAGFVLALTVLMRFPSLPSVGVLSLLVLAADRWWRAASARHPRRRYNQLSITAGPFCCDGMRKNGLNRRA
jgi:4-amino-4-deoxy-L-arabinose transferase-like glycosyltransferase